MYLVIYNNTKENFLWDPEKANVKFRKMASYTRNFQNFAIIFRIPVKFDIHFLGLPHRIFFGVITENVKKLFWYKVFAE